jgi:broad specificity phosphatase PhoE
MSILLVRHGETAGNAGRVMQTPDVPLNEQGLHQAEQLATRLESFHAVAILSSDLARAQMTARVLSRRAGMVVEESALLQERNFGDLRGSSYDSLPGNPFDPDFIPPNGESWDAFHARVAQAFAFLVRRRAALAGPLVVVTHGLVCRAIVERHAHVGKETLLPARFDNASLTILDAEPPHFVRLLNSTDHLGPHRAPGDEHGTA